VLGSAWSTPTIEITDVFEVVSPVVGSTPIGVKFLPPSLLLNSRNTLVWFASLRAP